MDTTGVLLVNDDLEMSNARSIVASWRTGKHRSAWGPAARDVNPSETTYALAEAHSVIRRAIDQQADGLLALGFLPGHPRILALRTLASQQANEATRMFRWARALEIAEQARP